MPREIADSTRQLLQRVLEELPDAVRLVAEDGSSLVQNAAARDLGAVGLEHVCTAERRGRDVSCPRCGVQRALGGGGPQRWHVGLAGADGKEIYYECTLVPVRDAEGGVAAVLQVLRDATIALGLENYLIGKAEDQEAELEKSSRYAQDLVSQANDLETQLSDLRESQAEVLYRDRLVALAMLVAGLSHEIHTPLGAMASSADLMRRSLGRLRGLADAVTDEAAVAGMRRQLDALDGSVGVVIEGSKRIEGVLRSLRLFIRPDEAPLMRVDLREGLDSTIELLGYRLSDRIRITRSYGDVPDVLCRPDACNQVFMNVLLNAIQAIETSGEIQVRTRLDGADAVIEIEDDGVGIDDDQRDRIFELGFSSRAQEGGSGLGLALCRRIVAEHGGTIEVAGGAGEGTTFTIRIPVDTHGPGGGS